MIRPAFCFMYTFSNMLWELCQLRARISKALASYFEAVSASAGHSCEFKASASYDRTLGMQQIAILAFWSAYTLAKVFALNSHVGSWAMFDGRLEGLVAVFCLKGIPDDRFGVSPTCSSGQGRLVFSCGEFCQSSDVRFAKRFIFMRISPFL